MGDTGSLGIGAALAALALLENVDLLLPDHRRPVRDRDAVGHHPGRQLPGLRPAGVPHGADPPPLRAGGLAGDDGHRPLLDPRRAVHGARPRRSSTPTSWPGAASGERPRSSSSASGVTGRSVARSLLGRGRPRSPSSTTTRRTTPGRWSRRLGVDAGARAPAAAALAALGRRERPGGPEPGRAGRPPGLRAAAGAGVAVRRRDRAGLAPAGPPAPGPADWWRSPGPTARPRSPPWSRPCSTASGRRAPWRPATSACPCSTPSASRRRGGGRRGVVVPAAVHRRVPARGQLLAQPGRGPPGLAPVDGPLPGGQGPHLGRPGPGRRRRGQRRRPGRDGRGGRRRPPVCRRRWTPAPSPSRVRPTSASTAAGRLRRARDGDGRRDRRPAAGPCPTTSPTPWPPRPCALAAGATADGLPARALTAFDGAPPPRRAGRRG